MSEEGAQVAGGGDALREEVAQWRERMAEIKQRAVAEVDEKWGSAYRTSDVFDLKVKARLAGNDEYRKLQNRVRDAEAELAADSGSNSAT